MFCCWPKKEFTGKKKYIYEIMWMAYTCMIFIDARNLLHIQTNAIMWNKVSVFYCSWFRSRLHLFCPIKTIQLYSPPWLLQLSNAPKLSRHKLTHTARGTTMAGENPNQTVDSTKLTPCLEIWAITKIIPGVRGYISPHPTNRHAVCCRLVIKLWNRWYCDTV